MKHLYSYFHHHGRLLFERSKGLLKINKYVCMKRLCIVLASVFAIGISNAQQLSSLIDEALANSPEIRAFELKYQVAKEKVKEVNTLPNTQFGLGYFISEPETRTGAQRFKISAKQMLPSFGAITARENYNAALADAAFEDIAITKRKLVASVSQSYYHLYAIKFKRAILKENIELLDRYEDMALTSVEVGKASAVDVLRLQLRRNELDQLSKVLEQRYLAELTSFNKLLNRDKNSEVSTEGALEMPVHDELITSDNLDVHPELLKYERLYKSVEQSEFLNQKENNPMLGFGLDYIAVSERPNISFSDNGKDIVMPMLSVSIPIFNTKYRSRSKQNELRQKEILAQKQHRLNKLETLLDIAIKRSNSAQISYATQLKNLKQAKDAETILVKSYETGTIDFNDVLDIQELQLKFQMSQIDAIKSYYIQRTTINYLTN